MWQWKYEENVHLEIFCEKLSIIQNLLIFLNALICSSQKGYLNQNWHLPYSRYLVYINLPVVDWPDPGPVYVLPQVMTSYPQFCFSPLLQRLT